jgi:hypothetical protein
MVSAAAWVPANVSVSSLSMSQSPKFHARNRTKDKGAFPPLACMTAMPREVSASRAERPNYYERSVHGGGT